MRSSIALVAVLLVGPLAVAGSRAEEPWRRAGLSDRQAAAVLLDRLTYGPRPGEVDRVVALGVDRWLDLQLAAGFDDSRLEARLTELPGHELPAAVVTDTYPPVGRFLREAREAGVLPENVEPRSLRDDPAAREVRRQVMRFARERGYRRQQELGIEPDALYEGRDLAVTTDFRAVFAEVAGRHLGIADDAVVFPGWEGHRLPLFHA